MKFLLEEEAAKVVAQNHSHATKDLYDSIASGSFPEWRLYIQTMNPNDEDKYDFDPMDTTKIWPEELFPLQVLPLSSTRSRCCLFDSLPLGMPMCCMPLNPSLACMPS